MLRSNALSSPHAKALVGTRQIHSLTSKALSCSHVTLGSVEGAEQLYQAHL